MTLDLQDNGAAHDIHVFLPQITKPDYCPIILSDTRYLEKYVFKITILLKGPLYSILFNTFYWQFGRFGAKVRSQMSGSQTLDTP